MTSQDRIEGARTSGVTTRFVRRRCGEAGPRQQLPCQTAAGAVQHFGSRKSAGEKILGTGAGVKIAEAAEP